ncbi:MAG: glutamine-hydrolyzing GMP synthase, partial [Hyphomicrobiales bacterium]
MSDTVLIIDFGSQVTQLIARRVREAGVYSVVVPFQNAQKSLEHIRPRAIILSGGPASVTDGDTPRAPQEVFDAGVPVLGICYGQQLICDQLGGHVAPSGSREFGRAEIDVVAASALFEGVWQPGSRQPVWMSHGDRVEAVPEGFKVIATTPDAPFAAIANEARRIYGIQFHAEVVHTPDGARLLANFVHKIAGCANDWTMATFRQTAIAEIRARVGGAGVVCGLSGGVDSSVAALLLHEAIGDQLTCILVDHGLMRQNEAAEVVAMFRETYNIPLILVEAGDRFLDALEGEGDPEAKRKTIGGLFIEVFEAEAKKLKGVEYLAQGTL